MRKRWGCPRDTASAVSGPFRFVRAYSVVDVFLVLNIAQSPELLKSTPNPMCWFGAAANVATNSSARPAANDALVPAQPPSTESEPDPTVTELPGFQLPDVHADGSVVPPNSAPAVGVRMT